MVEYENWFHEAEQAAQKALCKKAKCGSVIVQDGVVVGLDCNARPLMI